MQDGSLRENYVPADNPARRRFALVTVAATFVLVCMGGLVTSHEAGLAVPDWPNTYGYNLFFFPISKWIGGIFFEHTHRLAASAVGLLTSIMAVWFFGRKARSFLRWAGVVLLLGGVGAIIFMPKVVASNGHTPAHNPMEDNLMLVIVGAAALVASFVWPKCEAAPKWLRRLGVIAFFAVVLQGVLGGLRVTLLKDQIGIFHATLAQLFFVLMAVLALVQTKFWRELPAQAEADEKGLRFFFLGASLLILCQLILGATMRHQHAGLSIPDFPAAYGKLWPDTSAAAIVKYNQLRLDGDVYAPITAFQVILQMVHRMMAGIIFLAVATCAWLARRQWGGQHRLSRLTLVWTCLIVVQACLGAATIWTGKSADIATAHVAGGALSLVLGGLISVVAFRSLAADARTIRPAAKNDLTSLVASSSITQ